MKSIRVKVKDSRPKFNVGDRVKFVDCFGQQQTDIITYISGNKIEGEIFDLSYVPLKLA